MERSISLATRRIRLRRIEKPDLCTLFQWRNSATFRLMGHLSQHAVDFEAFSQEYTRAMKWKKMAMLIVRIDTDEPVGFVFISRYSREFRYCFLGLYLSELFERKGYGVDAFVTYALYLFRHFRINNIYCDVFEVNSHSLSCTRNIGMTEVTRYKPSAAISGQRINMIRFAGDTEMIPRLERLKEYLSASKESAGNFAFAIPVVS